LCARHIVSSGIVRVVYIEPYPKSVAEELYNDSLTVDAEERLKTKVAFEPFVGISPGFYELAFRLQPGARKDLRGNAKDWVPAIAEPKLKHFVSTYLLIENKVLGTVLPGHFTRMGIHPVTASIRSGEDAS